MPAWQGRLSQDERWAVIDYLRTFSYDANLPGETAGEIAEETQAPPTQAEVGCSSDYLSQSNPFSWDDANAITAGNTIYSQSCEVCHGVDGSGTLPGATDFTIRETQEELRSNSGEFLCITAEGRGAMPGWKETLSVEQMWEVLTHIGTFGK
jgi:mono/diheme cytochrome c family protein